MTKFAEALFADLMRQHRATLERIDRPVAQEVVSRPLTGGRPPGPPRRPPSWLAPVAAAAGVLLALALAVSLGGLFTGQSRPGGQAVPAGRQTAWVFNGYKGTLTPISPVTGRLGKPIKVGPGTWSVKVPGSRSARLPHFGQDQPSITQNLISPDGKTDYVVYNTSDATGVLRPVSLVTGTAGRPIPLGRSFSFGPVAITPDGKTAYVPYYGYPPRPGSGVVRPVSLATGTVGKPILHGNGPAQIVITPDGTTAYVTFSDPGTVTPVFTATNTPGQAIPVPGAMQVVITADGRTADVISSNNTVTPIATATNTPGKPIKAGPPQDVVTITPDGRTAYVTRTGVTVTPVSLTTGRSGKPIKLTGAGLMAITPDSKTAYVVNVIYSRVTPINTATNTAGKPIRMSGFPLYIVISPNGRTAYAYTNNSTAPQIVTPISTATNAPGKPINVPAPSIRVIIPGGQDAS